MCITIPTEIWSLLSVRQGIKDGLWYFSAATLLLLTFIEILNYGSLLEKIAVYLKFEFTVKDVLYDQNIDYAPILLCIPVELSFFFKNLYRKRHLAGREASETSLRKVMC